ncbi:hypothetical protein THRCLA_21601 [Thraustotheca clavata]|uniref:Endonuclease/exonuclease/phosphatase domain-containing protein n=1 Tax=Thraustotheca clavata TaxID=74557 RepID=A0A1V9ZUX8_9STRA|nr:hypothetical protein THRCLA_21601 [Thraustotheca clavata]
MWGEVPIFYHNVYSPISNADRAAFYNYLPREFPPDALRVILGDFNFPMDRRLDSRSGTSNHHTARDYCFQWLQALKVVDAWRLHHPTSRIYSSPTRTNRLDYIFLDDTFSRQYYHDSSYIEPQDTTDHLWHQVVLQPQPITQRHGYWKLPKELLTIPDTLLDQLHGSSDPGRDWQQWKTKTKKFSVACTLNSTLSAVLHLKSQKSAGFRLNGNSTVATSRKPTSTSRKRNTTSKQHKTHWFNITKIPNSISMPLKTKTQRHTSSANHAPAAPRFPLQPVTIPQATS